MGSSIFDIAHEFFIEHGWPCTPLQGETVLVMNFSGRHGNWSCYAQAKDDREQFVFYSVCPIKAQGEQLLPMAEFLTRANFGLTLGNFEMDFEDGEIRYKTSIDVEGDRLSFALLKQLVHANVMIMDHYLPGIMAVLYGNRTPVQAIAEIEEPETVGHFFMGEGLET